MRMRRHLSTVAPPAQLPRSLKSNPPKTRRKVKNARCRQATASCLQQYFALIWLLQPDPHHFKVYEPPHKERKPELQQGWAGPCFSRSASHYSSRPPGTNRCARQLGLHLHPKCARRHRRARRLRLHLGHAWRKRFLSSLQLVVETCDMGHVSSILNVGACQFKCWVRSSRITASLRFRTKAKAQKHRPCPPLPHVPRYMTPRRRTNGAPSRMG